LRSLGVAERDLDDAIQDLFLVVQRKLPEFDGRVSPKTWLYAIAIRIARQYKERSARARRRNESGEELIQDVAAHSNTEADAERKQRLDLARVALEALDDDKREVFVFSQIEQLSAGEISEITGLPVNTVYSRLRAARSVFAAEIERLLTAHGRSK
jgi:RNA polymerase sigma-70 factor (ECF subfamily)